MVAHSDAGRLKAWRYAALMLKKIAVATALVVIVAAALYQFAGLRVALDGSGKWPPFVARTPDYDALEADRASQHQRPLPPAPDAPVSASRAMGLTPGEGRVLWEYPWSTQMGISMAQPLLLGNDRVFLSAGYGHGAAVVEVSQTGGRFATRTIWENLRIKNKFTSSVLHEGYIYSLKSQFSSLKVPGSELTVTLNLEPCYAPSV